ncbi:MULTISPECIES: hypothetical protein [Burkholderia cepacia complex]|nr:MULTISPECIES: hypothetical protein [Burkholderia cepacia complex]GAU05074.1 hypothetical protein BSLA_02r3134 [Burkholderia stabilis]
MPLRVRYAIRTIHCINGTLVGGLIGLGLYLVSLVPRWAAGWLH